LVPNTCRFLDEDKEGGLECVLGVLVAAEQATTNAPDHWAMPPYQSGKRSFSALMKEGFQQLPIRHLAAIRQGGPAKVLDNLAHLMGRHDFLSRERRLSIYYSP
jgi:hypothetical protein